MIRTMKIIKVWEILQKKCKICQMKKVRTSHKIMKMSKKMKKTNTLMKNKI